MNAMVPTERAQTLAQALTPRSFAEVVRFAEAVAQTQFVPQAFRNKPNEVIAAITYGAELGLSPMQSLRTVAVINGAPALFGDGLLAVCQSHPLWMGKEEFHEGAGPDLTAVCIVKRKGEPDVRRTFSMADAKTAGLLGKQGPWTQYPARMLMFRARGFALRDQFADALRGMLGEHEAGDYPAPRDVTPPRRSADTRRAAMAALDEPETVEIMDAYGECLTMEPGAANVWLADQVAAATEEELDALAGNNIELDFVMDAVAAERDRRAADAPKPAKLDFWSRPSLEIKPNDGGIEAWMGRIAKAIMQAPDLDRLEKLEEDNREHLEALGRHNAKSANVLRGEIVVRTEALRPHEVGDVA